jgi:replication factor A1
MNGRKKLQIKDLKNGMRDVSIEAKVTEKSAPRQVLSRYKDEMYNVATAVISDSTGTIKLTLWNEQINNVDINDTVKINKGYVTSFKGEIQLNIGKYGTLDVTKAK